MPIEPKLPQHEIKKDAVSFDKISYHYNDTIFYQIITMQLSNGNSSVQAHITRLGPLPEQAGVMGTRAGRVAAGGTTRRGRAAASQGNALGSAPSSLTVAMSASFVDAVSVSEMGI
jgi:hypothetical protein